MSKPKRYDDVIDMLTDQCHKYAVENARLKAEVERLSQPAVIGGYNLSQYIRMANSETLEFDNGDIFADMTLPERIKYIVESHARLKAEVERLTKAGDLMCRMAGNNQVINRHWKTAKGVQP